MHKLVNFFFVMALFLMVYNISSYYINSKRMQITSQHQRRSIESKINYDQETADNTTDMNVEEDNDILDETTILHRVSKLTQCIDKPLVKRVEQRGDYYVLYNYVIAERTFRCFESVTYTTQGDLNFLDNLVPLVEKWQGPISVSVYAPGTDFLLALRIIYNLRECKSPLVKEYVSFHLFFETKYTPKIRQSILLDYVSKKRQEYFKCNIQLPYEAKHVEKQFKSKNNLVYPINVARNSARLAAQTHFVLASDIELYPSPNFIPKFLEMIARNEELEQDNEPKVFVVPHFEVEENVEVPTDKTTLVRMVENKTAFLFHEHLCSKCHMIPNYLEWLQTPESDKFNIIDKTKRQGPQRSWEPFYVGTNDDPLFDERLSWEGQKNKMTQNYILCLLDYTYLILDNAFLVHRPGIKKAKVQMDKYMDLVRETSTLVRRTIKPEIHSLYGIRAGCHLG